MKYIKISLLILSILLILIGCTNNTTSTVSLTTTKDDITTITTQEDITTTTTQEITTTTQEPITTTQEIVTTTQETTTTTQEITTTTQEDITTKHVHRYSSNWIVVEPTDTTNGYRYKKCNDCDDIYIDPNYTINSLSYIDGLAFELSEDETYYIVSNKSDYKYDIAVIPSLYNNKPVREIKDRAFFGCNNVSSIYFSNSITSIGNYAFYGCSSLASLAIPDSITKIEDFSFQSCTSLKYLTIPDSVTTIGEYAFSWCSSLTSLAIPNSVKSIGTLAFSYCSSLTSITIPNSVTTIGDYVSRYCYRLVEIINKSDIELTVGSNDEKNIAYYAKSIVDDESKTKLSRTEDDFILCTIDDEVILVSYLGDSENVVIPSNITTIGNGAFYDCSNIQSIELTNHVTLIRENALYGCSSLASIKMSNSMQKIESNAIMKCEYLKTIQYNGTMDEWNLIDRELNSINTAIVGVRIEYYDSLQGCAIVCTDGMIVY